MKLCETFRESICLLLDGEIEPNEDLLAHLKTCQQCQKDADLYQRLSELLKSIRPMYRAPRSLREKVRKVIARISDENGRI